MAPRGGSAGMSRGSSARLQGMLRNLFERGDGSDCRFIAAGGGRVFHLHKLILSQASPVLARMLDSGFKEGTSSGGGGGGGGGGGDPVVVGDASPEVLGALFAFVYGQDVPLGDAQFACELWELAHRFEVCELEALARAHTREALARQPLACFEVLQMARGVGDDRMVEVVRAHMAGHLQALAASPLVAQLALDDLESVLVMGGARERKLEERFGVIMRWVDGDIRDRARFVNRLMTYVDLSQASPKEVAMMAARPGANESNVLMRKLAECYARLHAERATLTDEVKTLRYDVHSAKARALRAETMEHSLIKLEEENAALRANAISASIEQAASSLERANHLANVNGYVGDGFVSGSTSLSGGGSGMGRARTGLGAFGTHRPYPEPHRRYHEPGGVRARQGEYRYPYGSSAGFRGSSGYGGGSSAYTGFRYGGSDEFGASGAAYGPREPYYRGEPYYDREPYHRTGGYGRSGRYGYASPRDSVGFYDGVWHGPSLSASETYGTSGGYGAGGYGASGAHGTSGGFGSSGFVS